MPSPPPARGGLYFKVIVDDTVDEWVGGAGIGVARSVSTWRQGPDKTGRMLNTRIVGHRGGIFLNGKNADLLTLGQPQRGSACGVVGYKQSGDLNVFYME